MARRPLRPWLKSIGKDKFKQAGLAYLFAGLLVILFTFSTQLVPKNRSAEAFLLFPGVFFVLAFASLVYVGPSPRPVPPLRRSWVQRLLPSAVSVATRWVARVLALTSAGRGALFLSNALGQNIHLTFSPLRLFVAVSVPEPLFFVNAVLMVFIAFMLARAGWDLRPGQPQTPGAS